MTNKTNIKEIFTSIQGEGPYVGYKQLFVRFCGCNLSCEYCDTDFSEIDSKKYSVDSLLNIAKNNTDCHSISLTGGEPLLHAGFLKEFLPQCPLPVYLETNATLAGELGEIIDYVDYIAADIKLPSCCGGNEMWSTHDRFFEVAKGKKIFAKVVFDENITEGEIVATCSLCAKYLAEIILQPKMVGDKLATNNEFIERTLERFLDKYQKVRVIPQIHKFLNVR